MTVIGNRIRCHRAPQGGVAVGAGPEARGDYEVTVARVAAITYGKPARDPVMLQSGITRAEAMAYRDARGQAMTDADWTAIEDQLLRAYQLLKTAVAGN